MEFITDVITPAQLTGSVQALTTGGLPFARVDPIVGADPQTPFVESQADQLLNLFPIQQTDDIEYELENTDLTGVDEVARYRSWDTAPKVGKRPGITIIGGEIVPLDWSYRMNEKDLQRYGKLRQALAQGGEDPRVIDALTRDAIRAGGAVQNRITLAHADILNTGSMTLEELGNPVTGNALAATFPVPANQIATASTLWSDHANADAVGTLQGFELTYANNNNGMYPDEWWVSREVGNDLLLHAKLLNRLVFTVGSSNAVQLPNIDTVNSILSVHGVVAPVRVVNVRRPTMASSNRTAVLNTRACIGVRAGMGRTLFTPPASVALMPQEGRIEAEYAAGIIAYSQANIRPAEVITTAEAVAVPVLSNPRALFIGTV